MVTKNRLIEILELFKEKKIAVIGDVTRISPEAPVPVVAVKKERFVLGGAANVVNNLSNLGVEVYAFGVIGNDNNGEKLCREFEKKGINLDFLFKLIDRPTIMKQRILSNNQQLLRLDWEKKHPIESNIEEMIIDSFKSIIDNLDAIILSDYDKGLLTEKVAKEIIKVAKEKNKIVIVDPKPSNMRNYIGATSMTPNLKEASECARLEIPETEEETIIVGEKILNELGLDHLLMTRSEKGMSIFTSTGIENIPTFAKEVYDVTGAGDTVISVYTLALTTGASREEAAKIANTAAGVVVGRVGTSTVTTSEIIEFYEEIYKN